MSIGVIGGGAWGTALAQVIASGGEEVVLWAREPEVVASINERNENAAFLKGVALSDRIAATAGIEDLASSDMMLAVAPAQFLRPVLGHISGYQRPIILCSKGIEAGTRMLMSEVTRAACPNAPVAVVSGPTFAYEVANGLPTAVTLACEDAALGGELAKRLARPHFRPYLSADVIGAEIGGAVKNVLAIACGIVEGAGLGQNARAALIARGFAEMTRFGLAKGAQAETLAGLSGLGDLVLTCSSTASRNFSLGVGIGQGKAASELLGERKTVAEGAATAPVLCEAAQAMAIDMPIVDAVSRLIKGEAPVREVIAGLLARPLRPEA